MQIAPAPKLTRRLTLLLAAGPLLFAGATVAGQEIEPAALDAALEWLVLLDNRDYGRTWDEAADLFQTAITRAHWIDRISSVRQPLGRLIAREFKAAEPVTNPAGVPKGDYLVIRFTTSFEHLPAASETIVLHHAPEGAWKVSGYFIRPSG